MDRDGRRRDTTARCRDEALAKAAELVAGLARDRPTDWARAPGGALVAHYLDPQPAADAAVAGRGVLTRPTSS